MPRSTRRRSPATAGPMRGGTVSIPFTTSIRRRTRSSGSRGAVPSCVSAATRGATCRCWPAMSSSCRPAPDIAGSRPKARFLVVGAYPDGRAWDLLEADTLSEADVTAAEERIAALPVPARDPVTGEPMASVWPRNLKQARRCRPAPQSERRPAEMTAPPIRRRRPAKPAPGPGAPPSAVPPPGTPPRSTARH